MERRFRLRRAEDFARLRQSGKTIQNRYILLSHASNGLAHNRYGLVTSGRVGGAVMRNRMRRLLREVVRAVQPQMRVGHDVVLVVRTPLTQQPFDSISRIVTDLFRQADLMIVESSEG